MFIHGNFDYGSLKIMDFFKFKKIAWNLKPTLRTDI